MYIEGSWKNIVPVCGNHGGERIPMVINNGPHSLFYSCPKYHPENREKGERACNNRINLIEYEKMVSHVMEIIAEEACKNNDIDLTNYKWTSKGIHYKVLEHKDGELVIEVLNARAMRK